MEIRINAGARQVDGGEIVMLYVERLRRDVDILLIDVPNEDLQRVGVRYRHVVAVQREHRYLFGIESEVNVLGDNLTDGRTERDGTAAKQCAPNVIEMDPDSAADEVCVTSHFGARCGHGTGRDVLYLAQGVLRNL